MLGLLTFMLKSVDQLSISVQTEKQLIVQTEKQLINLKKHNAVKVNHVSGRN